MSEDLPLDDSHWVPMAEIFARLRSHLGGQGPTEHDLSIVLAENRLHCLNRYRTPQGVWERKLVSLLSWLGREVQYWTSGKFTTRRQQNWLCPKSWANPRLSFHLCDRGMGLNQSGFGDGILYAWLPDLERLWPAVFAPQTEPHKDEEPDEEPESDRLGIWLNELYANNEWRFLTAKEVYRDIMAQAKELTKRRGKRVPGLSYTVVRQGLNERRK